MLDSFQDSSRLSHSVRHERPSKKQSTLAELLDQPFPQVQKYVGLERKSSSSPARQRIQRLAGRPPADQSQNAALNSSFQSNGSRTSSLKKPPRPTDKASKLCDFTTTQTVNKNKHPCFENVAKSTTTIAKGVVPKDVSQLRSSSRERQERQQQRQKMEKFTPQKRILKDVMRVDSKGRLVKENVVVSLDEQGNVFSSDFSVIGKMDQTGSCNFNLDSSIMNMSGLSMRGNSRNASPGSARVDRTLASLERKSSRGKHLDRDQSSFFDASYDHLYQGVPRLTALEEFMTGGPAGSLPRTRVAETRKGQAVQPAGKKIKLSELMNKR